MFIMPNLAQMIKIALDNGEVAAIVGQRHYSGAPVLGWDQNYHRNHSTRVFHAYGLGGSGLTLAPSLGEYISTEVGNRAIAEDHLEPSDIIVFGAGYIGILAALELRRLLNKRHKPHIKVRVIAQAYPKGISELISGFREPRQQDNYSSQTAGGWVMPVSIDPLEDHQLWCSLIHRAQVIWQNYTQTPPLSGATRITQSWVFYDQLSDTENPEDKSGIRTVNQTCPFNLYPEHPISDTFYSAPFYSGAFQQASQPLHFDRVVAFDNIIQTETVSVLQYFTRQLLEEKVQLIQTEHPVENFNQLSEYFTKTGKNLIVNASGHGAHSVFGCRPSQPIRGDLVLLRLPVHQVTESMDKASGYSFWAGGCHYVFLRYSMDRQWLEVVLGGTFIKNDDDLTTRPATVQHILNFWLEFFHFGSVGHESSHRSVSDLVNQVLVRLNLQAAA